jgi:AcrB/AcrD/AcrF family
MTTLAMIAGMLPLALGLTERAAFRKALATVVVGGLTSSLALTLLVVPTAWVTLVQWRTRQTHPLDVDHRAGPAPIPAPRSSRPTDSSPSGQAFASLR